MSMDCFPWLSILTPFIPLKILYEDKRWCQCCRQGRNKTLPYWHNCTFVIFILHCMATFCLLHAGLSFCFSAVVSFIPNACLQMPLIYFISMLHRFLLWDWFCLLGTDELCACHCQGSFNVAIESVFILQSTGTTHECLWGFPPAFKLSTKTALYNNYFLNLQHKHPTVTIMLILPSFSPCSSN